MKMDFFAQIFTQGFKTTLKRLVFSFLAVVVFLLISKGFDLIFHSTLWYLPIPIIWIGLLIYSSFPILWEQINKLREEFRKK
jgi:hypothetical protein